MKRAEVCGQVLFLDGRFLQTIETAWLSEKDLIEIAERVCRGLKARGWFTPQSGIFFAVAEATQNGILFGYAPVSPFKHEDIGVVGGIFCFKDELAKSERELRSMLLNLEKRQRIKMLKKLLRAKIGMSVAHEITHAYGINLASDQFGQLPIEQLELLTDASAFLSCQSIFRDEAMFSVPYIGRFLKQQGRELDLAAVRSAAEAIVAFQKPGHG